MQSEAAIRHVPLWDLLKVFLKVGATGFGGAMAMLAMIQAEVVQKHHWVTPQEFSDGVTLGQVLPGPIAIDTAAYLGYKLHGWAGAILSVIAFVLPSFLLMLVLTLVYLQYGTLPHVAGAFKGIGAAVVALIVAASFRMGQNAIKDAWSAIILAASGIALAVFQVNIVLIIVVAGLAGFILYRNKPLGQAPGRGGRQVQPGAGAQGSPGQGQRAPEKPKQAEGGQ
ncbi:MAG: chromate transporter [Chloroflexi bacterium]|nr:chromate transporter [Chloroflexota bacterium]